MFLKSMYYTLQMMYNQWRPRVEIEELQVKRLKYIVDYAYRNTPFYHRTFKKAGIHPSDIQSLNDLKKIPLTNKDEILTCREDIVVKGYSEKNSFKVTTSGSSGRMLEILQDMRSVEANSASVNRAYRAMGRRLFKDRIAYIRHQSIASLEQFQGKLLELVSKTIGDSLWLPSHLDEDAMIEKLRAYDPTVITSYPSSLYLVAKRIKERGIEDLRPRYVMSGGELLTEENRSFLRDVFQCDVFDFYGAYELMVVAWECSHHGMHMDADNNILEFIRDGEPVAPGEPGEIVGTNLWYRAMPIIRYQLGDIASYRDEECTCGRGLPVMKMVEGRKDDYLILPSGRVVGPRAVKPIIMTFPEVDKLRIVQEKKDLILIQLVEKTEFTRIEELKQKIRDVLREDVELRVELVDDIPKVSGKLRAVFSKVVS
jgi:phenylacetate-CoA ligase